MSQTKRLEMAIGGFILVAVITIAGMIIVFGGADNPFTEKFSVDIRFNHIADLQKGAPVKLGGVRIGRITDIALMDDGAIKVSGSINAGAPLRLGTRARIATAGLVGDTFVELTVGKEKTPFPKDGSEIIDGTGQVSTDEILNQVSHIGEQVTSLVDNLNKIIGDDQFQDDIHATVSNAAIASNEVTKLLKDFRKTSKNVEKASEDILATTSTVKETTLEVKELIAGQESIKAIKETIGNVRIASRNAADMSSNMKNILVRSDKMLKEQEPQIRQAVANVNAITRDIRIKVATIRTDIGILRYFTTNDINQKIDGIFSKLDKPVTRISKVLSTMSKIDLMKAYSQGSRLAKLRERELRRMRKHTTRQMLEEEFKEEQRIIENREALLELGDKDEE